MFFGIRLKHDRVKVENRLEIMPSGADIRSLRLLDPKSMEPAFNTKVTVTSSLGVEQLGLLYYLPSVLLVGILESLTELAIKGQINIIFDRPVVTGDSPLLILWGRVVVLDEESEWRLQEKLERVFDCARPLGGLSHLAAKKRTIEVNMTCTLAKEVQGSNQ